MEVLEKYHLFDDVLPGKTGIYAIANIKNDKLYIGSASGVNPKSPNRAGFRHRFYSHRSQLKNGNHHAVKLRRAFASKKSNPDDYEIWILEYCASEICLEREQWYFDNYAPWYNSCLVAGSCEGLTRTPKARQTISEKNCRHSYIGVSPEGVIYRFRNANKFKEEFDLPYLSGIANTCKGVYNQYKGWYFCYEEEFNSFSMTDVEFVNYAQNKIRKVKEEGRTKQIKSLTKKFNYIGISPLNEKHEFNNAADFARRHKLDPPSITKCCKKKLGMVNDWIFFYEKEYNEDFDPILYRELHEIRRVDQLNLARTKRTFNKAA
jgi:group I intron endonuclease